MLITTKSYRTTRGDDGTRKILNTIEFIVLIAYFQMQFLNISVFLLSFTGTLAKWRREQEEQIG